MNALKNKLEILVNLLYNNCRINFLKGDKRMQNKYVALAMMGALVLGASQAKQRVRTALPPSSTAKKLLLPKSDRLMTTIRESKNRFLSKTFTIKLWKSSSTANWFIRLPSKPTLLLLRNIKSSWLWPKKTLPARFTLSNR